MLFSMKKMRSIIFKSILVRAIYWTEMLMSPLFLLKLEVLKKMEAEIQNQGIKLSLRFLLYFFLSVTKCYKNGNSSKMGLMAFKRIALTNSWIFVNVGFHETSQVLNFAYTRVLWVFLANGFKKKIMIFVKISERSTLGWY